LLNILKNQFQQKDFFLTCGSIQLKTTNMKKLLLTISFLVFAMTNAQEVTGDQPAQRNIIKTDVLELLLTTRYNLNVSWEHILNDKTGLELSLNFKNYPCAPDYTFFDLTPQVSYRYYLLSKKDKQAAGFYAAPFAGLVWSHYGEYYMENLNYTPGDFLNLNAGLQAGYQWQIKKKWVIDLYSKVYLYPNHNIDFLHGIDFGLKFGYKF
jgi:hypothetical protein